jgi:transposase InsO family protein
MVQEQWHQLRRDGIAAARSTVERLMRAQGLRGVVQPVALMTPLSTSNIKEPSAA